MPTMKTFVLLLLFLGSTVGALSAELGLSAGAGFEYTTLFQSGAFFLPRVTDPGAAVSGVDHFYDDGYNRVDSSGNFGQETTYWGYQTAEQDNGNSITMNSARRRIDAATFSESQTEMLPSVELYWLEYLTKNKRWNLGMRASLLWQHIRIEERFVRSTAMETVSDAYSYVGIPSDAPFNGSYAGPNFLLSDSPLRSISVAPDASIISSRELNADLAGLCIGPVLSWRCSENLNAVFAVGEVLMWIDSDFSYTDGALLVGGGSEGTWLPGFFVSTDLQYKVSERWGLFVGAVNNRLQDFRQAVDGHNAEVQFADGVVLRAGLYFQ